MPRKPTKSREQKVAENFFPVDEDDVKYAIEKPHKPLELAVDIEKNSNAKVVKKIQGKKQTKRKTKQKKSVKEFKIPKITLKPEGYELIITEKPQAALKIASALSQGQEKSFKKNVGNVPYYEINRQETKKKIIVACAVGHLFTLTQKTSNAGGTNAQFPVFDIIWVPNHFVRKGDFSKKYYDVLLSLVKNASSLTVATDYDIEGEVIGLNVIRFIAGQTDASRMKFSTLTDKELNQAYNSKSQNLDWGQAIAGETRHILDWFYGINLSRALMNAIKTTGRFRIFSIGRVQGPALNIIVQKEKLISSFKPQKYWQIFIQLTKPELELIHNKDIFNKSQLKAFETLKGKTGTAETKKTEQNLMPLPPFNLTALQTEAYRIHGFSPSKTLQLAQSLYLNGLISYPRTSSQKLPASIGYTEILDSLSERYNVKKLITRTKPIEGKKSDPAHPSIYPTGQQPEALSSDEKKIYELIVKRFLSLFCEDAIVENKTIKVEVDIKKKNVNDKKIIDKDKMSDGGGDVNKINRLVESGGADGGSNKLIFIKKGSAVKKSSWLSIYPRKIKEQNLPDINGAVVIKDVRTEEKETQPPKRYTPASLVSELEKRNLGTKATRASIIETLYNRGYVKGQSIEATPLGISLIETLEKHSQIIIDEKLTHHFEREMEKIQTLKKNYTEKEQKVIAEAKDIITNIINQFKSQEQEIGSELLQAQEKLIQEERQENKLNICPGCNKGNLRIMYSKKTRRSFIGCSNYPECKNTYSLPPNSLIKKSDKICESCGFPMLISIRRGKRPWIFCFNPECETNRERLEAYRKKQQESENNNN